MRLLVVRRKAVLKIRGRATLLIRGERGDRERPLRDLEAILVIGEGIMIDSSVPPVLAQHNIPLAVIAKDNIALVYNPVITKYNNYRKMQYTIDKARALDIALEYIKAKINGMINIIKYKGAQPPEIPPLPRRSKEPESYEHDIRLWESTASNTLWDALQQQIEPKRLHLLRTLYGFTGRRPRHPDPFNKTLSVMYAVIYALATKALLAAGLDPTHGFLHKTRYSTPLTFDYTEMFKPIAMQATIDYINTEDLPKLDDDGELDRNSLNNAIKWLYKYLTLKHTKTRKTPYQYIYLKAFCLAKHLENKCKINKLTIIWDRKNYK